MDTWILQVSGKEINQFGKKDAITFAAVYGAEIARPDYADSAPLRFY